MSASYLSVLNKLQSTEHARTYVCTCRIPEHVKQQNATSLAQRKSSQCVAVDSSKPGERSQGVSIDMAPARRGIAEKREKHRSNWHTGSVWCKPCRFGRTFFGTPVVVREQIIFSKRSLQEQSCYTHFIPTSEIGWRRSSSTCQQGDSCAS